MNGYRISQLAEHTGFSASTLRYYEQIGLLEAQRTPSGYRTYGEADVARLRFIANAKRLGLPLDDIRDLVAVWDGELCASARARLRESLTARSHEVAQRIDELSALGAELRQARSTLEQPDPPGPCDDACGCLASSPQATQAKDDDGGASATIACTLNSDGQTQRVAEWKAVLASASGRRQTAKGLRITFGADPALAGRLAELAARERQCCSFFAFSVGIPAHGGVTLDVHAPSEAQELVTRLFYGSG